MKGSQRRIVTTIAIGVSWVAMTAQAAEVGVYYYPWYGSYPGGHSFDQTLREHLNPREQPVEGHYSSRDRAVIESQIDQSHRGNISFWATSWWGPGSNEDNTFRNSVLTDPRAGELKYAVHYESTGRLGTFRNPDYSKLVPDFEYLGQNYFNNPNYLKINSRPVVFIYLTRAYFNTAASRMAVANLRQTMQTQFHVNPYLVGDDVFPGDLNATRARLWDAITDFDVYGSALQAKGSTRAGIASLNSLYQAARNTARSLHIGFIPTVSPGFNDRAVRSGHDAAPRYLTDVPGSKEGSLFTGVLRDAVVPNLDPAADNILMVNSFNEWHEDTQIEATLPAPATTQDDTATLRGDTQGYTYSGYGNLYLDELKSATVPEPAQGWTAVLGLLLLWRSQRRKR